MHHTRLQPHSSVQASTATASDSRDSASRVQLRGKSFAEQEAALSPVQMDGAGGGPNVHALAAQGTAGGGGALPHLAQIQHSFGRHDVSGVQAHQDAAARGASDAMGANAYASGNHVAFGQSPDLHTTAHEAAHVVQQRAGVSLSGGVGKTGDAYEKHADAVADAVVQGKSAEGLLDGYAGGGGGGAVQLSPKQSAAGTFTDEKYAIDGNKLHAAIKFTPGEGVDATKIAMVQTIKSVKEGKSDAIDPMARERTTDEGVKVDRLTNANTGVYGSTNLGTDQEVKDTKPSNAPQNATPELNPDNGRNATYQLGHRTKSGETWDSKDAGLYDGPTIEGGANSQKEFETAAVAIDGPQKGAYYGSVHWGWKKAGDGTLSTFDFDIISMGAPSKQFNEAVIKFNGSKVRGTIVPIADDTQVLNGQVQPHFKLMIGDEAVQKQTVGIGGASYVQIEVTSEGANKGKTGYVKVSEVKDKGDGATVKALPVAAVSVTTQATKLFGEMPVEKEKTDKAGSEEERSNSFKDLKAFWSAKPEGNTTVEDKKKKTPVAPPGRPVLKELPKDTRVKVLSVAGDLSAIEIVDGADTGSKGFVTSADLKKE